MSAIELPISDSRWHAPADVLTSRVLIACVDRSVDVDEVVEAVAPARSSVLVMALSGDRQVEAVAATVERLLRDGCAASEMSIVGIGRMGSIAPAVCILLRMRGLDLPAVVALAHGDDALVLRPDGTLTEALVEVVAGWPSRLDEIADQHRAAARAASGIDRVLSAGWS